MTVDTVAGVMGIMLDDVRAGGVITSQVLMTTPIPAPSNFTLLPTNFALTASTVDFGRATVRFPYYEGEVIATGVSEPSLRLLHYTNGEWRDITTALDINTNVITGVVNSFSPFVIGVKDMVDCAVSINNGAIHTGRLDVQLFSNTPATSQALISNDAGFSGAQWQPYSSAIDWTLADPGEMVVTLLVYARLRDADSNYVCGNSIFDSIIYDPLAPVINTVTLAANQVAALDSRTTSNITLQLSTEDQINGSGVEEMQISTDADFTGVRWRPYSTTAEITIDSGAEIYIRVRDGVGNVSSVESINVPAVRGNVYLPIILKR